MGTPQLGLPVLLDFRMAGCSANTVCSPVGTLLDLAHICKFVREGLNLQRTSNKRAAQQRARTERTKTVGGKLFRPSTNSVSCKWSKPLLPNVLYHDGFEGRNAASPLNPAGWCSAGCPTSSLSGVGKGQAHAKKLEEFRSQGF